MRFGVVLPTYLPSAHPGGIGRVAELAEELGYGSVWTTDHVMVATRTPTPYQSIYEAIATLAWVAARTRRVQLGISVLIVTQRNAVIVAKELATIDALSGGRVILGVGAGYVEDEFRYLNADFRRRGAVLEESIAVLRHLWRGDPSPFHGRFHRFEGHSFAPLPARPGGPPIWIGGTADAALSRAARLGDGWHSGVLEPDEFGAAAARIRAERGDRPIVLSVRANVRDERSVQDTGFFGKTLTMGGGIERIREDVRRYAEAGCEDMALNFWDGDVDRLIERMRRFRSAVMPAFA